jgi:hypothetical protein
MQMAAHSMAKCHHQQKLVAHQQELQHSPTTSACLQRLLAAISPARKSQLRCS